jgi:hypothetical protein
MSQHPNLTQSSYLDTFAGQSESCHRQADGANCKRNTQALFDAHPIINFY